MKLSRPKQYRDYLLRYAENGSSCEAPALGYAEFCEALEVWVHEYHAAWTGNDSGTMARLEQSLQLEHPKHRRHSSSPT